MSARQPTGQPGPARLAGTGLAGQVGSRAVPFWDKIGDFGTKSAILARKRPFSAQNPLKTRSKPPKWPKVRGSPLRWPDSPGPQGPGLACRLRWDPEPQAIFNVKWVILLAKSAVLRRKWPISGPKPVARGPPVFQKSILSEVAGVNMVRLKMALRRFIAEVRFGCKTTNWFYSQNARNPYPIRHVLAKNAKNGLLAVFARF